MSGHHMLGQLAGLAAAGMVLAAGLWITSPMELDGGFRASWQGAWKIPSEIWVSDDMLYVPGSPCQFVQFPVEHDIQACD